MEVNRSEKVSPRRKSRSTIEGEERKESRKEKNSREKKVEEREMRRVES
jgi:hypothetical protein